ncbi:hypothetical protein CSUI_007357, partial [Cystoisospora suis]
MEKDKRNKREGEGNEDVDKIGQGGGGGEGGNERDRSLVFSRESTKEKHDEKHPHHPLHLSSFSQTPPSAKRQNPKIRNDG